MRFADEHAHKRGGAHPDGQMETTEHRPEAETAYRSFRRSIFPMANLGKLMKSALFLSACTGVGVMLWVVVAPSEERKGELRKNFPEANPMRNSETLERNILVMQAIKEAAETNENVARRTTWSK